MSTIRLQKSCFKILDHFLKVFSPDFRVNFPSLVILVQPESSSDHIVALLNVHILSDARHSPQNVINLRVFFHLQDWYAYSYRIEVRVNPLFSVSTNGSLAEPYYLASHFAIARRNFKCEGIVPSHFPSLF